MNLSLLTTICLNLLSATAVLTSRCGQRLEGECQCKDYVGQEESAIGLRVECSQTNVKKLQNDIAVLKRSGKSILSLQVRDSDLRGLYNLPSGLYNVHELILDNTGIDLQTIRESNELLNVLKELRVYRENFTEIPEDFFLGMDELRNLSLNDIGIAYISKDAFTYLEDSLKHLELRQNKLRSFPIAIQFLSHLESLDLFGNDIKTVPDDVTAYLQSNLKRLKKLRMDQINCTCLFGKTDFAAWIRSHAIKGVICETPNRLLGKDISVTPIEDFCDYDNNNGISYAIRSKSLFIFNFVFLLYLRFSL